MIDYCKFSYQGIDYKFAYFKNEWLGEQIADNKTFYALPELEAQRNALSPQMTVIDCGANIGNHSVFYSKLVKKVYAIEPLNRNFQLLRLNASLNASNIECIKALLGSDNSCHQPKFSKEFWTKKANLGNVFYLKSEKGIVSQTLDNLFPREKIDCIKIDVEGMEIEVLKGATEILKKWHPKLFMEIHDNVDLSELNSLLNSCGYKNTLTKRTGE